jgi:hypothetical protein
VTEIDGQYHELRVRVDRPAVALDYRQGYYAVDEPKLDSSQKKLELSAALLNPVDSAAIGVVASLDVKPGSPRTLLSVRLRLDPETLSLQAGKTGQTGKVEEMLVEFNAAGREVGRVSAVGPFEIKPESRDSFEKRGVTMAQTSPSRPMQRNCRSLSATRQAGGLDRWRCCWRTS